MNQTILNVSSLIALRKDSLIQGKPMIYLLCLFAAPSRIALGELLESLGLGRNPQISMNNSSEEDDISVC